MIKCFHPKRQIYTARRQLFAAMPCGASETQASKLIFSSGSVSRISTVEGQANLKTVNCASHTAHNHNAVRCESLR